MSTATETIEWIPADERLPPAADWVLAVVNEGFGKQFVIKTWWNASRGHWGDGTVHSTITHWAEMPVGPTAGPRLSPARQQHEIPAGDNGVC